MRRKWPELATCFLAVEHRWWTTLDVKPENCNRRPGWGLSFLPWRVGGLARCHSWAVPEDDQKKPMVCALTLRSVGVIYFRKTKRTDWIWQGTKILKPVEGTHGVGGGSTDGGSEGCPLKLVRISPLLKAGGGARARPPPGPQPARGGGPQGREAPPPRTLTLSPLGPGFWVN